MRYQECLCLHMVEICSIRQVHNAMDALVHELRLHGQNTLQLLDALDSNGDGRLTSHELRSCLWNMNVRIGTYDLDMAMRAFDADQNGYVDRSELMHCISEYETLLEFRELHRVLKMQTDARAGKLTSRASWDTLSFFDRHTIGRVDPVATVFENGKAFWTSCSHEYCVCACIRNRMLHAMRCDR